MTIFAKQWWREEYAQVIRPAFRQMQGDYYFAMGWIIRGRVYLKAWLYRHRRTWYLALCGFLVAVALITSALLAVILQTGHERAYYAGVAKGFSDSVPAKARLWWFGGDYNASRKRAQQQLMKDRHD